jgi:hypothetical protein
VAPVTAPTRRIGSQTLVDMEKGRPGDGPDRWSGVWRRFGGGEAISGWGWVFRFPLAVAWALAANPGWIPRGVESRGCPGDKCLPGVRGGFPGPGIIAGPQSGSRSGPDHLSGQARRRGGMSGCWILRRGIVCKGGIWIPKLSTGILRFAIRDQHGLIIDGVRSVPWLLVHILPLKLVE